MIHLYIKYLAVFFYCILYLTHYILHCNTNFYYSSSTIFQRVQSKGICLNSLKFRLHLHQYYQYHDYKIRLAKCKNKYFINVYSSNILLLIES